jgi:hypothetical protein
MIILDCFFDIDGKDPNGLLIPGDKASVWCGNRWCRDLSIVAGISTGRVW